MKAFTNFIVAAIVAFWISAIAVFSIQNITEISLNFLLWQSIKVPVGVLLSFCGAGGVLFGALLPLLWQQPKPKRKKRLARETQEFDEFDFEFDDS